MALSDTYDHRLFAYEIKFLVTPSTAEGIREWARRHLDADPNGSGQAGDTYLTSSLYYDTPAFDVYARHGSFGRSKYRVRRYCDGGIAFLERKLKTRNLVSKRRSIAGVDEVGKLGGDVAAKGWPGYWFHRRVIARGLRPVCQISYRRTARVAMTGAGPIRLTIDEAIRAIAVGDPAFQPSGAGVDLTGGLCILELKYRRTLPAQFKRLIAEFGLRPQPVSKYRLAAKALRFAPEKAAKKETGVPVYA
jgi:hypothetical protein